MATLPWFKCNHRDFLEGIEGLTRAERGDYLTILLLMYRAGGPIKNDPVVLRNWLQCYRLADCQKRVQRLVDLGKLHLDSEGMIHNGRVDRELAANDDDQADISLTSAGHRPSNPPKKVNGFSRAMRFQTQTRESARSRAPRAKRASRSPRKETMGDFGIRMLREHLEEEARNGAAPDPDAGLLLPGKLH